MLFIIRNEEKLSIKTNFIVQLLSQKSNIKIFYVFKKESEKFNEIWSLNRAQLPSSIKGLIAYYLLMLIKSPKDFRNGIMVRLSLMKAKHVLADKGFLSILSSALYLHFGNSARADRLIQVIEQVDSPKTFLIDEFLTLNCIDLKILQNHGSIIYVSQDVAYNRFSFGDNFVTKNLMLNLERNAIDHVDLVVACSEMERLKYIELGARNAIFYPNIYPTKEFEPIDKDEMPSISIVLRGHWGGRSEQSLEMIFNALASLNKKIRVYLIGIKPHKIPKNVLLEHHGFISSKLDYLKVLNKSWIGINVGIHMAGTNQRKYDYAEAGTVVLSDRLGIRGDLLPHEFAYVDRNDLAAKIGQLLNFGKYSLTEMGKKNRKHTLYMAQKEQQRLLDTFNGIICNNNRS